MEEDRGEGKEDNWRKRMRGERRDEGRGNNMEGGSGKGKLVSQ